MSCTETCHICIHNLKAMITAAQRKGLGFLTEIEYDDQEPTIVVFHFEHGTAIINNAKHDD